MSSWCSPFRILYTIPISASQTLLSTALHSRHHTADILGDGGSQEAPLISRLGQGVRERDRERPSGKEREREREREICDS